MQVLNREAIGSLMFFATGTRPDIAYAKSTITRFVEPTGQIHWIAVNRLLRYLKEARVFSLCFEPNA